MSQDTDSGAETYYGRNLDGYLGWHNKHHITTPVRQTEQGDKSESAAFMPLNAPCTCPTPNEPITGVHIGFDGC